MTGAPIRIFLGAHPGPTSDALRAQVRNFLIRDRFDSYWRWYSGVAVFVISGAGNDMMCVCRNEVCTVYLKIALEEVNSFRRCKRIG